MYKCVHRSNKVHVQWLFKSEGELVDVTDGYLSNPDRCLDLEIWWFFVDDNDNDRTDYFTPCTCMWGNYPHMFASLTYTTIHRDRAGI